MFSQTKAISEESLIDKLIELNVSKADKDKSLAELITELDDTYLLETLFKEESETVNVEETSKVSCYYLFYDCP